MQHDDAFLHGASLVGSLSDRYRVSDGRRFRLGDVPTSDPTASKLGKARGRAALDALADRLAQLQATFYADGRRALLVVFQAMDAGGKDGTISHVFSRLNPQGLQTVSFKPPTPIEATHDFLWRVHHAAPARGMFGVFNRSHYEDVVVARVHPELLAPQRLLDGPADHPRFWAERLRDIRDFEAYLGRQGTCIVKIFLHISQEEQRKRLLARLDEPSKTWKFDPGDLREREFRPDFLAAYQDAIAATATKSAPWYVVPADQKWFARAVVAAVLVATLERLDLEPPQLSAEQMDRLADARRRLGA